jgi:uncharacterized protein (DUF362 family)
MSPEDSSPARREVLISLLRLGGLSAAATGQGFWLNGRSHRPEEPAASSLKRQFTVPPDSSLPEMAVTRGGEPRPLVQRTIQELGGIRRFISRGDVVVIKPNMAWDRTPNQAANTNPEAVAAIVRLCLEAGAKKVIVTDVSINEPRRCFERSGIAAAAHAEGAQIILPEEGKFREVDLHGEVLRSWPVFEPFLEADKMINMPVAKHHSLTGATLGMKNWYGILGGQRQRLHQRIHESLVDLAGFMRPTVTVIDAYRVLLRNGPGGGNPGDVALEKTVIAGTDPVALDAYAAKAFWDLDHVTLRYLKLASDRGLGSMNLENVRTRLVDL